MSGEDEYIREWISFHLAVGIEHFLVIDNSRESTLPSVISDFIQEGKVSLRRFESSSKPQIRAYNRALSFFSSRSRWVAFLDIDEFLFPSTDSDLPSVLRDYEQFPGVAVNWVCFGTNGHIGKPQGWTIENFTDRGPLEHVVPLPILSLGKDGTGSNRYRPINCHVKCIVDPSRANFFRTAHHLDFLDGVPAVTEKLDEIRGPFSESVSINRLRINHYWSKSVEELRRKQKRGRVSQKKKGQGSPYPPELVDIRIKAASGVTDESALRFLTKAKELAGNNARQLPRKLHVVRKLRYDFRGWQREAIRSTRRFISMGARKMDSLLTRS